MDLTRCVRVLLYVLISMLISFSVFAQNRNISSKMIADTVTEKNTATVGLNFLSDNVFLGRVTTDNIPIFSPYFRYDFKSGIYFSADVDLLPANASRVLDGGDITAGYEYGLGEHFSGIFAFTKIFYSKQSSRIGSSARNEFSAGLDYTADKVVTLGLYADYDINTKGIKNDVFVNLSAAHNFNAGHVFSNQDEVSISPTLAANAGTQNFYNAYISKRTTRRTTLPQSQLTTADEQSLRKFQVLDYEISLPIIYKYKHVNLQITPTYAIVENDSSVKNIASTIDLADKASLFYLSADLSYSF